MNIASFYRKINNHKFKNLQDRMVIVMEVYIRNSILKNRNPRLLSTLAPSFPIS